MGDSHSKLVWGEGEYVGYIPMFKQRQRFYWERSFVYH